MKIECKTVTKISRVFKSIEDFAISCRLPLNTKIATKCACGNPFETHINKMMFMKNNCDRCGGKTQQVSFTFNEVNEHNGKHEFGIFCAECTTELLDELRGKLEWFHIERSWKGYIHHEARPELEQSGFIHPKHRSQYIEVKQVERIRGKIERTDAIAILRVEYAGGLISKGKFEKALREIKEGDYRRVH